MRYMTAELLNDLQEEEAGAAEYAWEANLEAYEARLKAVTLPPGVRAFLDWGNLHDASVDRWSFPERLPRERLQFVVRQRNWGDYRYTAVLRYELALPGVLGLAGVGYGESRHDALEQLTHRGAGFDAGATAVDWLYDEFDERAPGVYEHRVLLSNGVELGVLFADFHFLILDELPGKTVEG